MSRLLQEQRDLGIFGNFSWSTCMKNWLIRYILYSLLSDTISCSVVLFSHAFYWTLANSEGSQRKCDAIFFRTRNDAVRIAYLSFWRDKYPACTYRTPQDKLFFHRQRDATGLPAWHEKELRVNDPTSKRIPAVGVGLPLPQPGPELKSSKCLTLFCDMKIACKNSGSPFKERN